MPSSTAQTMMMNPLMSLICNALVMVVDCAAPNAFPSRSSSVSCALAVPEVDTRMARVVCSSLVGGTTARAGVDYKDPRAGMVTATELMREEYIPGVTDRPQAPAAGGLVDLGKEVAPPANSR